MIDKPQGPTSHDIVDRVRAVTGVRRVGHVGTLDPLATGLLVVLIGRTTRLAQFMSGLDKRYAGVIRLGEQTDTDDRLGRVVARSDGWRTLDDAAIGRAMGRLVGRYDQRPPAYSAKKVSGERAYRRARRGASVVLAPRPVIVHDFRFVSRTGPDVRFEAHVGSGSYVRALARDLGELLECGAHLRELRRYAVGPLTVQQAISPDALAPRAVRVLPPLAAVAHLPVHALDAETRAAIVHGRAIRVDTPFDGPVALVSDGALLGVAMPDGGTLRPRVVVAE